MPWLNKILAFLFIKSYAASKHETSLCICKLRRKIILWYPLTIGQRWIELWACKNITFSNRNIPFHLIASWMVLTYKVHLMFGFIWSNWSNSPCLCCNRYLAHLSNDNANLRCVSILQERQNNEYVLHHDKKSHQEQRWWWGKRRRKERSEEAEKQKFGKCQIHSLVKENSSMSRCGKTSYANTALVMV